MAFWMMPAAHGESQRARYERARSQLDTARQPLVSEWQRVTDYILPGRGRYFSDGRNKRRSRKNIIDSTATLAAHRLSAGFMSHMTSPAREWKELTIPADPDLAKWGPARKWLELINDDMSQIFRTSGTYQTLPIFYLDFAGFGTSAFFMEEDLTRGRVIRTQQLAIGSYYLANGEDGRPAVFMRYFPMSVRQLVEKFARKNAKGEWDLSNFSTHVQEHWSRGNYEVDVEVCHVVHPNLDYRPFSILSKHKKFKACYYETGAITGSSAGNYMNSTQNDDKYLSERGHDFFPVIAGRWSITDGDSYGTDCPGFMSLGDVISLQTREKVIARGEEKSINPPMVGTPALQKFKSSSLPGDITYDPSPAEKMLKPAFQVTPRIDFSEEKQKLIRARINDNFYVSLFLSATLDDRGDRGTAYEWSLRKQEELAALGPVVENVSGDALDPLVENTYQIMLAQRRIPPPPKELEGRTIGVRYVSSMAQAQKATGLGGIERFLGVAGEIAKNINDPYLITDKANIDETLEAIGEMTGVPARMMRDEEETEAIRESRRQQQEAAALAERAKLGAETARDLSQAKTDSPSALTDIISAASASQR